MAGINAVSPGIIDAARGMGLTASQILFTAELPNAASVILTGFRIALVINVGTAPLGYLVGAGGLGDLIFTGIDMMEPTKLLAGAIPTTLLALAGDYLCELLGLLLIPRGLRLQKILKLLTIKTKRKKKHACVFKKRVNWTSLPYVPHPFHGAQRHGRKGHHHRR